MESTFWRHWWWNGGYFGSIYQVKALLPKAENKQAEMVNNLAAGTVGGFIGTVMNTPCEYSLDRHAVPRRFTSPHLHPQSMSSSLVSSSTPLASGEYGRVAAT